MATESRAPVELRTIARYESLIRVSEALRAYHDRETLFRSLARELRHASDWVPTCSSIRQGWQSVIEQLHSKDASAQQAPA